jgi:hypothetical protein
MWTLDLVALHERLQQRRLLRRRGAVELKRVTVNDDPYPIPGAAPLEPVLSLDPQTNDVGLRRVNEESAS